MQGMQQERRRWLQVALEVWRMLGFSVQEGVAKTF